MKTTLNIIITTTMLFLCCATACIKTPSKKDCGLLPCPTASGTNIVSCLVNGKPYIARGGKPDLTSTWGGCKQGSYYQEASGLTSKYFSFRFCDIGFPDEMTFYIYENLAKREYIISNINTVRSSGVSIRQSSDSINGGKFTITTLTDKVISGTFELTTESNNTQLGIQKVTQGSFDLAR